jgi:hypothetical protein
MSARDHKEESECSGEDDADAVQLGEGHGNPCLTDG